MMTIIVPFLWFTASDYPFSFFKLFLENITITNRLFLSLSLFFFTLLFPATFKKFSLFTQAFWYPVPEIVKTLLDDESALFQRHQSQISVSCKSTFFPFDPFSYKKNPQINPPPVLIKFDTAHIFYTPRYLAEGRYIVYVPLSVSASLTAYAIPP